MDRCLHRKVGHEETGRAPGRLRSELGTRLTEEFAGNRARPDDCFHEIADDALGLIVVEVDVVMQRARVQSCLRIAQPGDGVGS
jgi:hypothetical protein